MDCVFVLCVVCAPLQNSTEPAGSTLNIVHIVYVPFNSQKFISFSLFLAHSFIHTHTLPVFLSLLPFLYFSVCVCTCTCSSRLSRYMCVFFWFPLVQLKIEIERGFHRDINKSEAYEILGGYSEVFYVCHLYDIEVWIHTFVCVCVCWWRCIYLFICVCLTFLVLA